MDEPRPESGPEPPSRPAPKKPPHSGLAVRAKNPLRAARERLGLAVLAVERARRGTLARVRRSHLLRWRHQAPIAHDLVLAPPDLRPQDPSFPDEVASENMGLAGATAALRGASPFTIAPPTQAWARELHGFGWLGHFAAARTVESEALARRLVGDWIALGGRKSAHAWAPDVVGRRMVSWLSHTGLILDGAERRPTAAVLLSLEDQATYLSASWANAPAGYRRLLALIGLAQAGLCIAGHERRLGAAERHLTEELERQILPDGGHVSRNPRVLVELLLDLLPLRQCFIARELEPARALTGAIDRMIAMLGRLRLGDGRLARFNGTGATERDALATVLAYANPASENLASENPGPVSPSRYVRLQRGATVVLADAGPPPPLELAGHAGAGCLAFELSAGSEVLFCNAGAPGPAHAQHAAAARGTASHSTLVLGGQSSARLVRDQALERRIGGAPIQHPDRVTCELRETADGAIALSASHDGYAGRFGLIHTRTLALDATGTRLEGTDQLAGAKGVMRFAYDVPFAVHFHLHPRNHAHLAADGSAELVLPGGERWRFSAIGAALGIEESTHYAEIIGPLRALQVVLRAVCYGAAQVRWTLQRLAPAEPQPDDAEPDAIAEAGAPMPDPTGDDT